MTSAVRRCGPDDSYRFVANEFRCPAGANPLAGNMVAGRRARRGSVRDPDTGHFVDIYEVPCNPSPVRVYVDMYGCAEYQAKLRAPESEEAKRVQSDFAANRFQAVANRCTAILHGKELGDAGTRCLTILPASLYLLGKRRLAIVKLGEVCAAFPRSSVDSDVRARLVLETLGAIAEGSERARIRIDRNQIGDDLTRFVTACQVPDDQIEKLLEPMQQASTDVPRTYAAADGLAAPLRTSIE